MFQFCQKDTCGFVVMLTIALATAGDAVAIHAIQMRAFAAEARLSGTDQIPPLLETVGAVAEMIQSGWVWKALIGGALVGFVG